MWIDRNILEILPMLVTQGHKNPINTKAVNFIHDAKSRLNP